MIPVGYSDGTYNIVNCKFPLLTLSSDDYAHKHVILGQLLTNSEIFINTNDPEIRQGYLLLRS